MKSYPNSELLLQEAEEMQKIILGRIQDALEESECVHVAAIFDGSKESTVILHILKETQLSQLNIPVVFVDTASLLNEVYDLAAQVEKRWDFRMVTVKGERTNDFSFQDEKSRAECCDLNIVKPLYKYAKNNGIKKLLTGHGFNGYEKEIDGLVNSHVDIEIIPVASEIPNAQIWKYIRIYNLPYCSIYDKGYKKVGCEFCIKVYGKTMQPLNKVGNEELEVINRLKGLGYI